MVSRIVTPKSTNVTIEIPEGLVNRRLHVEIWEELKPAPLLVSEKEALVEVSEFYASTARDLGAFVFDRGEIHER